ncbi:exotoxin A binding domain-containing protein, partial [Vibrio cholerae]
NLDITTENGTKTYSYNRKEGEFAINWLVPIGEDSPASIKISVDELDQQRNIIEVPKLYSIDLDNQTLEQWKTQGNVSFSVTRPEHNIAISWPSVSYKAAQKEGSRHKRWAHWHTGLALCWLVPIDAIYNYIT